jgi:hypothetical protein
MNQDQRRALKQLKEMYPKSYHKALESSFKEFVIREGGYKNNKTPIDLVEAYIKWSTKLVLSKEG